MKVTVLSAQEQQDALFRRMTTEEKVKLGSDLWRLGHDLAKDKITYAPPSPRSTRASRTHRQNP